MVVDHGSYDVTTYTEKKRKKKKKRTKERKKEKRKYKKNWFRLK